MIFGFGYVAQHGRRAIEIIDDDIQTTIAIQIAFDHPATDPRTGQAAVRRCADTLKSAVRQIAKQQRLLGEARPPLIFINHWINVAVGNEHIQPAIVIKIYEVRAPS